MGGPRYDGVLVPANSNAKNVYDSFDSIKSNSVLFLSQVTGGVYVMDGGELESYRHFAANVSHVSGAAVVFRGANCEEHFWIFKWGRLIHDEITDLEPVEQIIGRMKNGRFLEDFICDDRKTSAVKLPSFLTFVGDFESKDGQPRTAQGLRRQLRTAEKLIGMGKLREALGAAEELFKYAEEHLERRWSWRIEYLVGAVATYVKLQWNGHKTEECDGAQAED